MLIFINYLGYADMEASMRLADMGNHINFSLSKALFSKDFTEKRYHKKVYFTNYLADHLLNGFIWWLFVEHF